MSLNFKYNFTILEHNLSRYITFKFYELTINIILVYKILKNSIVKHL